MAAPRRCFFFFCERGGRAPAAIKEHHRFFAALFNLLHRIKNAQRWLHTIKVITYTTEMTAHMPA